MVAVLDACFSGAGGRSVLPKGVRPLVTKVETGALSPGKVVAFGAAGPDEITGSLPGRCRREPGATTGSRCRS